MLAYVSTFTKSAQEKPLDGKDAPKQCLEERQRSDSGCCEDENNMPEPKELRPREVEDDSDDEKTRGTRRDDEILALELDHVPDDVLEYARRELGETEEVKCQTIHELREMIYERGECDPHRMDDAFLLRFLRARNFNVNRAHRLVVRYYTFKDEHPELHENVNPLDLRYIGEDDVMTVPAYRAPCGRRLMIYRIGNWDPRKYSVDELFKATMLILELGLLEPAAQILGGIVIFDFEGISMAHAWTMTPQVASMVFALIATSFPITTHAIHIVNQSWIFDTMFAVFKPLIDSKMNSRIFFHGSDMESLHRHLPPDYLPKKYGGTRDELPYYRWIDALGNDRRVVKEMKSLGYVVPEQFRFEDDADD